MQRHDGLLTLYIQHEAPEGGKRANWNLAPAWPFFMAGTFLLPGGFAGRWFTRFPGIAFANKRWSGACWFSQVPQRGLRLTGDIAVTLFGSGHRDALIRQILGHEAL
jgi:hypothetical protein